MQAATAPARDLVAPAPSRASSHGTRPLRSAAAEARPAFESDARLMARVQSDDADAFEALFDRFGFRAQRVAYAISRDHHRAEDITQEAFLSAWRGRDGFRPQQGSVAAWLLGIVRNRAIDSVRRDRRHDDRPAADWEVERQQAMVPAADDAVAERQQAAELRLTLARLPAAQRDVIVLAYFGELSTSEIAAELDLPLGTIKGRMRLGLKKLRAGVAEPLDEVLLGT